MFLNKGTMHYININDNGNITLSLNSFSVGGVDIDWVIYKEGNDTIDESFTASLTDANYFQTLTFTLGSLTLQKDSFYIIEGRIGDDIVYRGKVLAKDGDTTPSTPISIHKDEYTEKLDTNDYIILE